MKDFKDKIAVVTGAASGIGLGMTETFVAAGMKVLLADIEPGALEETTRSLLATGADVYSIVTDVSQPNQVENLAKRTPDKYGAVHILCNNAGVTPEAPPGIAADHWIPMGEAAGFVITNIANDLRNGLRTKPNVVKGYFMVRPAKTGVKVEAGPESGIYRTQLVR